MAGSSFQKDLNIAYIDADEDGVSNVRTLIPNSVLKEEDNKAFSKLGEESKRDSLNKECIIDMSDADNHIGASIDFGLTKKHTADGSQNDQPKIFEMSNISRSSDNQHSLEDPFVKHSGESGIEQRKKAKKRKKSKSKETNVTENLEESSGKVSTGDGQKMLKDNKPNNYESGTVPESDSNNNKMTNSSGKPLKRTVKWYRAEKQKNGTVQPKVKVEPHSHGHLSKAEQRKLEEEKKMKILPDEEVNAILKICGDPADVSTENKKKSKENRQNVPKKDKKKAKKQKKGEKHKEKKTPNVPENIVETSQFEVQEEKVFCFSASEVTRDDVDDNEEFITQRRRKAIHKQPTSGETTSDNFGRRKRRFSDPSPSVKENLAQGSNKKQFSANPQDANIRLKYRNEDATALLADQLYNRNNQSQWPTLPSLADTVNYKNMSGRSTASYASKLKSNLDSTGCSLASSSEDGSTSSSSSNNCNSAGQTSPIGDHHVAALSSMPLFIDAAAAHMVRSFNRPEESAVVAENHPLPPIKPSSAEVEPIRIVDMVVCGVKSEENNAVASIAEVKPKENVSGNIATSSFKYCFETSNENKPNQLTNVEMKSQGATSTAKIANMVEKLDEQDEVIFEFMYEDGDSKPSETKVISELENEWGLNFFTDEFTVNDKFDAIQINATKMDVSENIEMQVTFGGDKFVLNELDLQAEDVQLPTSTAAKTDCTNFLPFAHMRISDTTSQLNDPGDFDLQKSTDFLMLEWNSAVCRGNYYEED